MGKGPGKFGDLGKAASDLLSKDFGAGKNTVELKTQAPDAVTFTTSGTHKPNGATDASVQAECKPAAGVTIKGKIDAAGVTTTSVDAEGHLAKGLKLSLAAATPPVDKGGFIASSVAGFELSTDMATAAGSFDYHKGAASCSAVAMYGLGMVGVKGGVSLNYDVGKAQVKGYQAKLAWGAPVYTLCGTFKADGKGGAEYSCSYHHVVYPGMQVAAEVGYSGSSTSVAAVAAWPVDCDTTSKAKVDSSGMASLSLTRRFSKACSITIAGCFDINFEPSKTKTGIAIKLTPN